MRKSNTLFDQVCQFVNNLAIGEQFAAQDMYNKCDERMTHWKQYYNNDPFVTRTYRRHLAVAGVLRRVGRGVWQVLAHVPDFVTVSMLEANRGSKKQNSNGEWVLRGKPWNASMLANVNGPAIKDEAPELAGSDSSARRISMQTLYTIVDAEVVGEAVPVGKVNALLSTGNYYDDESFAKTMAAAKKFKKDIGIPAKAEKSFNEVIWQVIDNKIIPVPVNSISGGNTFSTLSDAELFLETLQLNAKINLEKSTPVEEKTEEYVYRITNHLNREVFWDLNGEFFKGKITSYEVSFDIDNRLPRIYDIRVETLASSADGVDQEKFMFEKISSLSFTKDDLLNKMSELVNNL